MDTNKELIDNHGREISYLRLSVTDRCNLRCTYCMPEEGINFVKKEELLSYEEMLRLCKLLADHGVKKVRITGGEPFIRTDILDFLEKLTKTEGIEKVSITTNGVLVKKYLGDLKKIGINDINLSLDTFNPATFKKMTGRDDFDKVRDALFSLIDNGFNVKLNAVIIGGMNESEILPLSRLSLNLPVDVRFIEEMPFNGKGKEKKELIWTSDKILEEIKTVFPSIGKHHTPPGSTSVNYKIPGSKGSIGLIAAYTRTFCGSCNRIRVNATGKMRTCLYGPEVLDLKKLMRSEANDKSLIDAITRVLKARAVDGFEAEKLIKENKIVNESMTNIGG